MADRAGQVWLYACPNELHFIVGSRTFNHGANCDGVVHAARIVLLDQQGTTFEEILERSHDTYERASALNPAYIVRLV